MTNFVSKLMNNGESYYILKEEGGNCDDIQRELDELSNRYSELNSQYSSLQTEYNNYKANSISLDDGGAGSGIGLMIASNAYDIDTKAGANTIYRDGTYRCSTSNGISIFYSSISFSASGHGNLFWIVDSNGVHTFNDASVSGISPTVVWEIKYDEDSNMIFYRVRIYGYTDSNPYVMQINLNDYTISGRGRGTIDSCPGVQLQKKSTMFGKSLTVFDYISNPSMSTSYQTRLARIAIVNS